MSYRSDCLLLGLDPSCSLHPPDVIKERFRTLALELHPDVGGDRDRFEATRGAYERLYHESQRVHARCPECKGAGWISKLVGFTPVNCLCSACGGTGKR